MQFTVLVDNSALYWFIKSDCVRQTDGKRFCYFTTVILSTVHPGLCAQISFCVIKTKNTKGSLSVWDKTHFPFPLSSVRLEKTDNAITFESSASAAGLSYLNLWWRCPPQPFPSLGLSFSWISLLPPLPLLPHHLTSTPPSPHTQLQYPQGFHCGMFTTMRTVTLTTWEMSPGICVTMWRW